jgi:hypothetical protein
LLWPLSDDVSVDEVFGFGLSLDLSPFRKKILEAKKASTSLRAFRFAIFQQISARARMGGILRTAEAA